MGPLKGEFLKRLLMNTNALKPQIGLIFGLALNWASLSVTISWRQNNSFLLVETG
jgi:hypothetical protein